LGLTWSRHCLPRQRPHQWIAQHSRRWVLGFWRCRRRRAGHHAADRPQVSAYGPTLSGQLVLTGVANGDEFACQGSGLINGPHMNSAAAVLEPVSCLLCASDDARPWGRENGYTAVKCKRCGLVYVPWPRLDAISEAARTGLHPTEAGELNVSHYGAIAPYYCVFAHFHDPDIVRRNCQRSLQGAG